MHIVIGSIIHESNSFSPQATDLSAFADSELLLGQKIIDHHTGRGTEIGGILHLAAHRGIDVTPTVSATAMPAGPVTNEAFEFLSDKLLDGIKAAGDAVDAVLLVLHGAMLTETIDDPEGLLLTRVRDLLGPDVPVGMTLDHHANVTARMAEFADFFIAYRTHPHTDRFEVGMQAAELVRRMATEGLRPVMRVKKVPMLLCQESSSAARGPLVERIEQLEKKDKVLSASFCIGYPFADFAEVGPCAAVVTEADADLAECYAADFAGLMWSLRDKFSPPVPTVDEAIDEALGGEGGPYVLCDLGDCLLAGGTGDVTALLAALLRKRAENACMMLVDAAAVEECMAAGVGRQITIDIGGKVDLSSSRPVTVTGRVEAICERRYRGKGYDLAETDIHMGPTAVLQVGGIDVVLAQKRCPVHDPEFFRSLGIEPAKKKIVVVKDAFYTTLTYKSIARKIVFLNSPGLCNWDFEPSKYHNIRRPMYPFDSFVFDARSPR